MEFKGHLFEYEYCGKGWLPLYPPYTIWKGLIIKIQHMNFEWKMVKGNRKLEMFEGHEIDEMKVVMR